MVNHRLSSTTLALTAGLVTAQVVGTLQVGWSNRVLFNRTKAVAEAGYMAIPTHLIEPGLLSFKAAFGGGLFFTLTIGTFLSFLTIGGIQLWKSRSGRRKWGVVLATGIVIAGLVLFNLNGLNLFATAYILLVPLAVWLIGRKSVVKNDQKNTIFHLCCLLAPPAIIAIVWFPHFNHHIFINIRDHVLLSNSPGRIVNDYYYRYTLYPAESVKSLSQKQIRTFYLDAIKNPTLKTVLTDILVARDFFPSMTAKDGDVTVSSTDANSLVLKSKGRRVSVEKSKFINDSDITLNRLGDISDNNRWFRKLIYISLLIGFPLLVYFIVFGMIRRLLTWFFPSRLSAIGASFVCIGLGVMLLWVLEAGKSAASSSQELNDMVGSSDRQQRLIVLKKMDEEGIDPSRSPVYPSMLKSDSISERYWTARVLGNGRDEKTYLDLIHMLDDTSPNVVCMAIRSLGKRGNEQAVPVILNQMKNSDHWYVQQYAYNALKALKWRQHQLK